ncbi:hypothetical protein D9M70_332640 [compost metagenome]
MGFVDQSLDTVNGICHFTQYLSLRNTFHGDAYRYSAFTSTFEQAKHHRTNDVHVETFHRGDDGLDVANVVFEDPEDFDLVIDRFHRGGGFGITGGERDRFFVVGLGLKSTFDFFEVSQARSEYVLHDQFNDRSRFGHAIDRGQIGLMVSRLEDTFGEYLVSTGRRIFHRRLKKKGAPHFHQRFETGAVTLSFSQHGGSRDWRGSRLSHFLNPSWDTYPLYGI